MWIRSQDKEMLVHAKRLMVLGNKVVNFIEGDDYDLLGEYESDDKAIEVLDKIQNSLLIDIRSAGNYVTIFKMPLEENNNLATTYDDNGNTRCFKCNSKVEGGYCNCFI
ncbi:MAG TPA: hypothetical protein GXZ90_09060 [Clostridiales bacterium]|nr:hypothetical protein [Clostridiales bacterium]